MENNDYLRWYLMYKYNIKYKYYENGFCIDIIKNMANNDDKCKILYNKELRRKKIIQLNNVLTNKNHYKLFYRFKTTLSGYLNKARN